MGKSSLVAAISRSASRPLASSLDAWRGRPIRLTDGDFWAGFFGRESASGKVVTVDKALQLSAVWACVRLLSETIATLPLGVYQRTSDGGRKSAPSHSLYPVLHSQPNAEMTAVQYWEAVLSSLLLRGNAFSEKLLIGGRVVGLNFLLPWRVKVGRNDDGSLKYTYTGRNRKERIIPASQMMHIPAFSIDGVMGLSPIAYGANVFGAAMSADDASASTFRNGLMPTVYFKMDRVLNPDQRAEFRANMKEVTGAMNAGKSPVLEGGMSADTIGIDPTDAQLLESRAFGVEEICRWFRVPPFMVGHSEKSTSWGTGIEQQMIGFLTFALRPWLSRIEQAIRKDLLAPAERDMYFAEFNLEGLLRADSEARASFYSQMVNNGIYTRDEVRRKENLPAKGGNADVLTVQTAMAPIDAVGPGGARQLLLDQLGK